MNEIKITKENFLNNAISCVGICAPASGVDEQELSHAISYFKNLGIKVKYADGLYDKERFLGGIDEHRVRQLMDLFTDEEVQVIFAARGGYGSIRMLDLLDYKLIKKNKKPFVGFSDTTSLQLALWTKARLPSLSGITLAFDIDKDGIDAEIASSTKKCLSGEHYFVNGEVARAGHGNVEGRLLGGCLSLVSSLCGTDYLPDFRDSILFLEDVSEEPYKIDRMLNQLHLADVFHVVRGVVIGKFKDCIAKDDKDGTIAEVMKDLLDRISDGTPVLMEAEYSHHKSRKVLPVGGNALLNVDEGRLDVEGFSLY